ncbi:MAG: DNA polymerase III subunit delta [Alphaproteobacteria bacterium]
MKIPFRDIESFVVAPNPAACVILIYGPDSGLMRERSNIIGKTVVDDLHDPFNVCVLSQDGLNDDPARLGDEANAMSMMGGKRLIRIEDAGDKCTQIIKEYLENPNTDALILLEGGDLGPRSSLRKLCETAKNAAALPCYVDDERGLSQIIRQHIQSENLQIDRSAVEWLAANISGNRQKVRAELEKLVIYKGREQSPITLEDAQNICGQAGAQNFDDLANFTGGNNPDAALKSFNTLMDEGIAEIAVLRVLQNHFRRLHLAKALMQEGSSADDAMKNLRPPVFFKQQNIFKLQLNRWSHDKLEKILDKLSELEAQSKKTGTPVRTLCAQAVLSISMMR